MSRTIYLAIGDIDYSPYTVLHAYSTREAAEERVRAGKEWIAKWTATKPSEATFLSPEWKEWWRARYESAPDGQHFDSFDVIEVEMD